MKCLLFLILLLSHTLLYATTPMDGFLVSNLPSKKKAFQIFKHLDRDSYSNSQCYNRAHYWSYQMRKDYKVYSSKIFIFFTSKYKREIDGKWWFHVAPAVDIKFSKYVYDPSFFNTPVTFDAWENGIIKKAIKKLTPLKIRYSKQILQLNKRLDVINSESREAKEIKEKLSEIESRMRKLLIWDSPLEKVSSSNWPYKKDSASEIVNISCKQVESYSEAFLNQEREYCYIIESSMYYRAPLNIENLEKYDDVKSGFSKRDVSNAFYNAFRGKLPFRYRLN